jgi:hypothetical protein
MGAAPTDKQGEASGLLATGRVIAQSISVALTGTVFTALGAASAGTLLSSSQVHRLSLTSINSLQSTFIGGFHAALFICALCAAVGIFTSLARGADAGMKIANPLK